MRATRAAARHPRSFLLAALLLSLGIGTSTTLFSVMYWTLLKPLPVQGQDRLMIVWKGNRRDPGGVGELSYPEFEDWQRQSKAFTAMAAMPTTVYGYGLTLTGRGDPVELERTPVSAAFFSLLGVRPALGRTFAAGARSWGSLPMRSIGHLASRRTTFIFPISRRRYRFGIWSCGPERTRRLSCRY